MAEEVGVVDQPTEIILDQPIELTPEQFLAQVEKHTGAKLESIDAVKEKVSYTPPLPSPTDEQKQKAEKNLEKRILDLHIESGKTPEQYTLLKSIANGDLKELSTNQTKAELKEAGFTDDQIKGMINERYFQIDEKDIELEEDNEEKEFLKKKKEFGTKKLENRFAYLQKQAKDYIQSLTKSVNESDDEKKRMEQHASNVEAAIKNFQRKQTLELGKVDDTDIPPIDHEVPEEALTEVKDILKDPVKFEQQLFTKEGDLNLDFILPHLVRSASYKNAIKQSYLVGADRQVQHIQATFGSSVPNLGGLPKPDNGKGKAVRAGKSEFVAPSN